MDSGILSWLFSGLLVVSASAQDTTRLRLLFAGDIMQHDSQIKAAYDPLSATYDYSSCFQYIQPLIQQADLAVANLELTLAGAPFKGYPQFSAPDELAVALKDAGFDILVTANNHSLDRRKAGLERTIATLDSLALLHTGTFRDSLERALHYPLLVKKNGFTLSLLNYTYGTNGIPVSKPNMVNFIDTLAIEQDMLKAKSQEPDVIMVFMHWGNEYQSYPSAQQKRLARFCIDKGASLVIGSHPHVIQPMEWSKNRNHLVAYSLGNLVSGQQSRYRDGGALLWVELERVAQDTTTTTQIRDAGYELAWVYRDEGTPKKYYLLPAKEFESDTIRLATVKARQNFRTFVDDSRQHLQSNVNIEEWQRPLLETHYYRVQLATQADSAGVLPATPLLDFYGLEREARNGMYDWVTGKFHDQALAVQAWQDIVAHTPYTGAQLVWYYWGQRQPVLPPGEDNAK